MTSPKSRTTEPRPALPGGLLALTINGKPYEFRGDPATPLLWYLRDVLRLTGTKYGCDGNGCGMCLVLFDGRARPSCSVTMAQAAGHRVTTIEGLGDPVLHPVQVAFVAENVPLCGYCMAGQVIAAADLLQRKPHPSDVDIDGLGVLCRCGAYPAIRRAIHRAAGRKPGDAA